MVHRQTASASTTAASAAAALLCPTQTALNEAQPVIGKQCSLVQGKKAHTHKHTGQAKLDKIDYEETNWTAQTGRRQIRKEREKEKKKERKTKETKQSRMEKQVAASVKWAKLLRAADDAAAVADDKRDLN